MNNGLKLVVVLVVVFAAAGLYYLMTGTPPKSGSGTGTGSGASSSGAGGPGSKSDPNASRDARSSKVGAPGGANPPSGSASGGTNGGASGNSGTKPPSESVFSSPPPAMPKVPDVKPTPTAGSGAAPVTPTNPSSPPNPSSSGNSAPAGGAAAPGGSASAPGSTPVTPTPNPAPSGGGASPPNGAPPNGAAPTSPLPAKPAAATPPPASGGAQEYSIREGDTFTSIAEEYFGDPSKATLIAKENPTVDPKKLQIGQKIRLPAKNAISANVKPAGTAPPVAPAGGGTHVIVEGDTLASIADHFYGTKAESAWRRIYEANKALIGEDPAKLKVGSTIVIPPKKSS